MKPITPSKLKVGDTFYLNDRKNAKPYQAALLEVVEGKRWNQVIKSSPEKENQIFIMGRCGTRHAVQIFLSPDEMVFLNIEKLYKTSFHFFCSKCITDYGHVEDYETTTPQNELAPILVRNAPPCPDCGGDWQSRQISVFFIDKYETDPKARI